MAVKLTAQLMLLSCRRYSLQSFLHCYPSVSLFNTRKLTSKIELHPFLSLLRSNRHFSESVNRLPPRKDHGQGKSPITWKTVAVTAAIASVVTGCMLYFKKEKELQIEKNRTRSLGKASLGGSWELVDHTGKSLSSQDLIGRWILIYFGFTHCPDVCPDEIEKMCKVVDVLDNDSAVPDIIPLFITVDPVRDSVSAVDKYIKEFSSKLIGLTGSVEQVGRAAKAYRVYFSQGPKDDEDDYIVDHTIIMYLIDANGNFVDFYGQNKTVDEISNSIRLHMTKFKQLYK